MLRRLRESLLQANKVLLAVLAFIVVLILAWVASGLLGGENQSEQAADQEIVAQAQDDGTGSPAPEAENRNVDSYAAYEAKDPFRRIVEPAASGAGGDTSSDISGGSNSSGEAGGGTGGGFGNGTDSDNGDGFDSFGSGGGDTSNTSDDGTGRRSPSGGVGGQRGRGADSDGDKVSNERERQLGLSPSNPDTDGDGIRDGADDSNGDGRPDRDIGRRGGGSGGNDGLFDSGGSLVPGGK